MDETGRRAVFAALLPLCFGMLSTTCARADDTPNPCDALKRVLSAAPNFSSLSAFDGRAIALPYGDDAKCAASQTNYRCTWTPRGGSSADSLQGVAADIASCVPDASTIRIRPRASTSIWAHAVRAPRLRRRRPGRTS